jgi:hypothetical protein
MDAQTHWENIYGTKAADAVSWYRPHLEKSLGIIERAAHGHSASIIAVGGGESTLVDDRVACVDRISPFLIFRNRHRCDEESAGVSLRRYPLAHRRYHEHGVGAVFLRCVA